MKTQTKHSKISCDSNSKAHHFYYCLFTLSVDFMREWRSRKDLRVCFTSRNLKSLSPVDNRPITHSRRSILFHWFSNTRVGPKKVINLVSKKTKAPVSFPFLLTKKSLSKKVNIIIQQQHPTQFRYQKNQVFFRFSHDTAPPLSSQNSKNPFMCCLSKSIQRSRSFYNAPAHLAGLFFNLHNVRFILIALIKEN